MLLYNQYLDDPNDPNNPNNPTTPFTPQPDSPTVPSWQIDPNGGTALPGFGAPPGGVATIAPGWGPFPPGGVANNTPPDGGPGGPGGPSAPGGGPPGGWTPPTPNPLPTPPTETPPGYTPPPAFSYADYIPGDPFKAPSWEDAMKDPGYQFRTQAGEQALQNWAASRGTLNDSSTANALIDYGQNAASQEYGNAWNRAFNTWGANEGLRENTYTMNRRNAVENYNTNYQTQYVDPYKITYQGWKDATLDPSMHEWDVNAQNTQHINDVNNANSWNNYLQDWNKYTWQQNHWLDILKFYGGMN